MARSGKYECRPRQAIHQLRSSEGRIQGSETAQETRIDIKLHEHKIPEQVV